MWPLLIQTALLLILGQAVLGVAGYLIPAGWSWLGLLLTPLLVWFIIRTARVLRGEFAQAAKRRVPVARWSAALTVAVLWQLPTLAVLPAYTRLSVSLGWQGAVLPVVNTLALVRPGAADMVAPWLWLASILEMLLFTLVAARSKDLPRTPKPAERPGQLARVSGEWAPARRHKDVQRRNRTEK